MKDLNSKKLLSSYIEFKHLCILLRCDHWLFFDFIIRGSTLSADVISQHFHITNPTETQIYIQDLLIYPNFKIRIFNLVPPEISSDKFLRVKIILFQILFLSHRLWNFLSDKNRSSIYPYSSNPSPYPLLSSINIYTPNFFNSIIRQLMP